MRTTFALFALLLLAAPAAADDAKIHVSKEAWQGFQEYKAKLPSTASGIFAVSQDGQAWAGAVCDDMVCSGGSAATEAKKACSRYSNGSPCLIFARGRETVVPYQVEH